MKASMGRVLSTGASRLSLDAGGGPGQNRVQDEVRHAPLEHRYPATLVCPDRVGWERGLPLR